MTTGAALKRGRPTSNPETFMDAVLFANPAKFSTWAPARTGNGRSRHDYDTEEHKLDEMLNETYWSTLIGDIVAGDLVWISDAEKAKAVIHIEWVDTKLRRVGLSIQERISERGIVGDDGLSVKNRGPRGGFWSVMDAKGNILQGDMRTREEAERARDIIKTSLKAA
jgi:hypothetical protein